MRIGIRSILALGVCLLAFSPARAATMVAIGGHLDIGVAYEPGGLHLHMHAEDPLDAFGGGTIAPGEFDSDAFYIGVPGPSFPRPAGAQWAFLSAMAGDPIFYLPENSDPAKPFLGFATEELDPLDGWTSMQWELVGATNSLGGDSHVSIWSSDPFGSPILRASTLDPAADTWAGTIGSHVHYNVGFNREGLYQLVLRATLTNDGSGSITAGTYTEEETFLFAVGDSSIAAVPEPGTLVAVGSLMATMGWRRRRARMG